jgi:hypothetical protein
MRSEVSPRTYEQKNIELEKWLDHEKEDLLQT